MNKSKKSILNAIFAFLQMSITSLFSLLVGRSVLTYWGSDYNGINSIVTQLVNAIMILEGGFTLASNVALFNPFIEKNLRKINGILSATKKRFFKISLIAMCIGILISIVFPFFVSTKVPYLSCVLLMMTVLLPACFNLGYSMKYRVILLTDQKEYIVSAISTFFYALGNGIAYLVLRAGGSLLIARVMIMVFFSLGYYMIGVYCKRQYKFVDFNSVPLLDEIQGTRDVLVLKATSVLYTTVPIILISALPMTGAMLASIYAVYKNVISFVSNCIASITNAPRLSFGTLLAEDNYKNVGDKFNLYEKISFMGISIVLGATCLLIMPFVDLYTKGISDIDYHNELLAAIMLVTIFLEAAHIPSGQIIQMSGCFKKSKSIQTIAFIILAIGMLLGKTFYGLYGILLSVLFAALVLCFLEISYAGSKIINRNWKTFLENMLPSACICIVTGLIGFSGIITCNSFFMFVIQGIVIVCLLSTFTFAIYYWINPDSVKEILGMVKVFLHSKK